MPFMEACHALPQIVAMSATLWCMCSTPLTKTGTGTMMSCVDQVSAVRCASVEPGQAKTCCGAGAASR
eukprot:667209-Amphidinium_carterae.1